MNKLRKRMVIVVLVSVIAVFALAAVSINVFLHIGSDYDADQMTLVIENNNGRVPRFEEFDPKDNPANPWISNFTINAESEFQTRYFIVYLDEHGNNKTSNMDKIASINSNQAFNMAKEAFEKSGITGYVKTFRYRKVENFDNPYIIFLDCSAKLEQISSNTIVICTVGLALTIIITIIFAIASGRAIKPFAENQRKQKQFITDAGHELKTPLAIISANADVIEYKSSDTNEWTSTIKNQVSNMNQLISEMLILTKTEELDDKLSMEKINFSEIVNNVCEEFKEVFNNKKVDFKVNVYENIYIKGNHDSLLRLVSILIDNCAKYVPENGFAEVQLKKTITQKTDLIISNTDSNNEKIDCDALFDRFYRTDSSRNSKTGGHGIGLSIAKKISELHKANISAKQQDGRMIFVVHFP